MDKKKLENTMVDEILSQAFLEAAEREFENIEHVSPEDILTERQMKVERRAYEIYERSRQKKRISRIRVKRVACFLIVLVVASALLFSVPTVRAGFLQLVNRIFSGYTLIETDGKNDDGIVVFKNYMLDYIPKGFVVDENNVSNRRAFVFVSLTGEKSFNIKCYSKDNFTFHHDNEQSIIEEVFINGNIGYYSYTENDENAFLNWSDEVSHFVITGNISKEEMIKIAENLKYLVE